MNGRVQEGGSSSFASVEHAFVREDRGYFRGIGPSPVVQITWRLEIILDQDQKLLKGDPKSKENLEWIV